VSFVTNLPSSSYSGGLRRSCRLWFRPRAVKTSDEQARFHHGRACLALGTMTRGIRRMDTLTSDEGMGDVGGGGPSVVCRAWVNRHHRRIAFKFLGRGRRLSLHRAG
jgi:hypothetical protein